MCLDCLETETKKYNITFPSGSTVAGLWELLIQSFTSNAGLLQSEVTFFLSGL